MEKYTLQKYYYVRENIVLVVFFGRVIFSLSTAPCTPFEVTADHVAVLRY